MKPLISIPWRPPVLWLAALCVTCVPLRASEPPQLPPLTTAAGNPHLPGKFVWADLVTDDLPAARKFYGSLFGWTFREIGNYTIASSDERPMCGLFQRQRPADNNATPRWFGYISVPDVGRALKAATNAGGRILAAPQRFQRRGEQAILADPEGSVFGVMRSSSGDPEDFLPDPGEWVWIELLSRNARQAGEFYHAVAGYDVLENTTSAHPGSYVFASEGYARAAALTLPEAKAGRASRWLLFVRVKSVAACITRAEQLGGKVLLQPRADLHGGRIAVIADPTGAAIGIMEWEPGAQKGGQ